MITALKQMEAAHRAEDMARAVGASCQITPPGTSPAEQAASDAQ